MPAFEPVNDSFLSLDGVSGYVSVTDSVTQKGKQTLAATIDVTINALPATTRSFFGDPNSANFAFYLASTGIITLASRRAGGVALIDATTAIVAGKRYIVHGTDDGTHVYLYLNGTLVGSGSSQTGAIVKTTDPIIVGAEAAGATPTSLKVASFQYTYDGLIVCRATVRDGAISDLSQFAQTITLSGTEGTNYFYGSYWSKEPTFAGSVTL